MFNFIKIFIGSIGYLLLVSLLFLGFYPLKTEAKPKLELSKMLTCMDSSDIIRKIQDELKKNGLDLNNLGDIEQFKNLNQLKELQDLKNIEGTEDLNLQEFQNLDVTPTTSPDTINGTATDIQDPTEQIAKAGEAISKVFGSASTTKAEYCVLPDGYANPQQALELSLQKTDAAYTYGNANDILASLQKVPFVKLPELPKDTKTILVKSSYCNRPLNLSDLYIFTEVTAEGKKAIVMYNIELQRNAGASAKKKVVSNLIESGQFIKSKLYCNGK